MPVAVAARQLDARVEAWYGSAAAVALLREEQRQLAPLVTRELFAILATINKQERVSILVVEQNASLALNLAELKIAPGEYTFALQSLGICKYPYNPAPVPLLSPPEIVIDAVVLLANVQEINSCAG